MLDIKYVLNNLEEVSQKLKVRDPSIDLNDLVSLDLERRRLIREVEALQANQNKASKEIGARKKSGQDASDLLAEMKSLSDKIKEINDRLSQAEESLKSKIEILPNIPIEPTPLLPDKSGNKVIRTWGEFRKAEDWPFKFRNHIEVAETFSPQGGLDFPRAATMTGSGWALYRGELARLEWALVWFLIDQAVKNGRELILPPFLVNANSMYSSGQYPKFRDQAFECRDDDLILIPTSEVPLLNLYRNEILPQEQLPLRLASFTPCFRREAGTYGKDERGLIRVHQFNKVEIFALVKPEDSSAEMERMISEAEKLMETLELPFRTTLLAAGDMAQQAACTVDIEVWLPGQDAFSEVSSISNCTDYQARRAGIRYRPSGQKKTEFVHTLNGSALATSRLMVAILEHYQEADGGIRIPDAIKPYMGGQERIESRKI